MLGLLGSAAQAQDNLELGAWGNVFNRVTLTVFDNTRVIRGVIIGLENDFANTFGGDYSAMCWDNGFALVGVDVNTYPNAFDGSGQAILDKIHSAAITLNRPELDRVPFCVTGFSRGGDWSWSFAVMHPERVIALVTNKTSFFTNENTPSPPITASHPVFQIPSLLNTGDPGLDAPTVTNAVEGTGNGTPRFFNHFRPSGARYALTREMGAGHEIKNYSRMTAAFFGAMCAIRYPLSLDPVAAKPTLLPLPPESQGWRGDNAAYSIPTRLAKYAPYSSYTGTNAIATNYTSYLATEDIASLWRASTSQTDTVTIDRGYGVQEGTTGTVTVHTDGYPGATSVAVYDSATLAGTANAPTTAGGTTWKVSVAFHAPYEHVFYALVNGPSGVRTTGISPIYCQLNRPTRPATFTASGSSASSIQLSWSTAANAEYYRLTRTFGGVTTRIADVAAPGTSYTDTGLAASTSYTYHLQVLRRNMWSVEDCSATGTTLSSGGTQPPVIGSAGSASGTVGQAFAYAITASNSPSRFSVTGALPAGLALNTTTGVIAGTPTAAGTSSVVIAATNSGGTGSKTLVIAISATTAAVPVVTSAGTASGTVGQAFSYTITASNSPTSFSVTGIMPAGLAVNNATGVIAGTPTSAGSSSIGIRATNAAGTNSKTLVITIASGTTIALPVITSPGTASGTVGQAFTYMITATNSPTDYSVTGLLPAGLGVNNATGAITGMPTTAGTYSVYIRATNAAGTRVQQLDITIAAASTAVAPPVITSAATASGSVGRAFSYMITATNSPTDYSVTGLLPPGLGVNNATGAITGTPTTAGTYSVYIRATNAAGTRVQLLDIAIAPVAVARATDDSSSPVVAVDDSGSKRGGPGLGAAAMILAASTLFRMGWALPL